MSISGLRWGKRIAVGLAALLILGFAVGSLSSRGSKNSKAARVSAGGAEGVTTNSNTSGTLSYRSASGTKAAPELAPGDATSADATRPQALPGLPDRIVKNADITLQVRKGSFDDAWGRASAIARRYNGYVSSSNKGTPKPVPLSEDAAPAKAVPASGDVTIRVPARSFEDAVRDLGALGTVTANQISSQDVTQDFVDLQSRLRNQRAQQAVLLRLMAQAKTVGESLAVQQQLSQTQDQIEQITGRINELAKLTDLSTVTVHIFEPGAVGAPAPPETEGPSFAKAWRTSLVGLERMGTVAMIAGVWLVPFAVLALIGLALRRRFASPPAPTV
jgi:Domain of unknown function (DUF4349)